MCQTCIGCGRCTGEVPEGTPPGLCPHCRHENAPDGRVCEECGWPLPQPPGAPSGTATT